MGLSRFSISTDARYYSDGPATAVKVFQTEFVRLFKCIRPPSWPSVAYCLAIQTRRQHPMIIAQRHQPIKQPSLTCLAVRSSNARCNGSLRGRQPGESPEAFALLSPNQEKEERRDSAAATQTARCP